MSYERIKTLAENWFKPRLKEQQIKFRPAVQSKLGEFSARGTILSGVCYVALENLVEQEIERRGQLALEGYRLALNAVSDLVPGSMVPEIKRDLDSILASESIQAHRAIQYVRELIRPANVKDPAKLRAATLQRLHADLDLLSATLGSVRASTPGKVRGASKRPKRPARTDKQIYQEAGSQCVFCPERDVSALQVHHIDSNPTNNALGNLILVCATCHTKITADIISKATVLSRKSELSAACLPPSKGLQLEIQKMLHPLPIWIGDHGSEQDHRKAGFQFAVRNISGRSVENLSVRIECEGCSLFRWKYIHTPRLDVDTESLEPVYGFGEALHPQLASVLNVVAVKDGEMGDPNWKFVVYAKDMQPKEITIGHLTIMSNLEAQSTFSVPFP